MEKVRERDIDMFETDGKVWVRAGTGGVSTSEGPSASGARWWRLDAGYDHGHLLVVWNDHGRHWLWEPADDMPLTDFETLLRATHPYFSRVS